MGHLARVYRLMLLVAAACEISNGAFPKRPFVTPSRSRLSKHYETKVAFVPSASCGVAASLFNHNRWKRKRRRRIQNADATQYRQHHIEAIGESLTIASTNSSPSGREFMKSLQGGPPEVGTRGCNYNNGGDISLIEEKNSSTDCDGKEKDNEDDTKVSIHIYPSDEKVRYEFNKSSQNIMQLYNKALFIGLGISQQQFALGVYYHLNIKLTNHTNADNKMQIETQLTSIINQIQSQSIDRENDMDAHIPTLNKFWTQERLICEHTSFLSPRRRNASRKDADIKNGDDNEGERIIKGQNFRDALSTYAERMISIIEDEVSDVHHVMGNDVLELQSTDDIPRWNDSKGLLGWIEQEYGFENTTAILASSLLTKSEDEQLEVSPVCFFYCCIMMMKTNPIIVLVEP